MKNIIKLVCLSIGILLATCSASFAQAGNIKIGPGLILGSGVGAGDLDNTLGLKVDGYYSINEQWRAGADLGFFFPQKESGVTFNVWEINFNANYIFYNEKGTRAYGIGGLNILAAKVKTDSYSDSNSELGLNLGVGGEYDINAGSLFGEIKYAGIGGDADELVIGAGLRFNI